MAHGAPDAQMSEEESRSARIIEAHQDLIRHIESGSGRIRSLSVVTVIVALVLSVSYIYQLALPVLFGETTVTVNLSDPANVAAEFLVLALALLWLYVGIRDYTFSTRLAREIRRARAQEKDVLARLSE